MVKWVIIGVLLLPLAEIVAFLIVAAVIGGIWALLLMLATSLAGVMVLRRAGRARIARLRVAVADSDNTWIEANTGGSLKVLAGVLLFLPRVPHRSDGAGAADRTGAPKLRRPVPPLGQPPHTG